MSYGDYDTGREHEREAWEDEVAEMLVEYHADRLPEPWSRRVTRREILETLIRAAVAAGRL